MSELLFHLFGLDATPVRTPQEGTERPQETFYGLQGVLGGPGPSQGALEALSASGVTGAVHLRTLEDDIVFSLNGEGDVGEAQEEFLS